MTFLHLSKKEFVLNNMQKNPLQKTFSHSQDMSIFVGGRTLRLTAERAIRCPFLENQLARLKGLSLLTAHM